jgi:hypothetical protein
MSEGQSSGTGAMTEFEDEKVRKNDILSNRQKAQRPPGQSLDGKGVQADEYKDNPANRRPSKDDGTRTDDEIVAQGAPIPAPQFNIPKSTDAPGKVDRPGFDLGGSTGETDAGKGLGLGSDAKKDKKGWSLPR